MPMAFLTATVTSLFCNNSSPQQETNYWEKSQELTKKLKTYSFLKDILKS